MTPLKKYGSAPEPCACYSLHQLVGAPWGLEKMFAPPSEITIRRHCPDLNKFHPDTELRLARHPLSRPYLDNPLTRELSGDIGFGPRSGSGLERCQDMVRFKVVAGEYEDRVREVSG